MITDSDMEEAIDRISRTADGHLFYRWLQVRVLEIAYSTDPSTLLSHNGERMFASRLMQLMRTGIEESAGRTSSGEHPTERPVVIARRDPTVNRRSTARDRITAEFGSGSGHQG